MSSKSVVYETVYGTMKFPSKKKAEEFKKIICSWEGFTVITAPNTIEEAVKYHMAMEKVGITEVYTLMREREAEIRAAMRMAESERRLRYDLARLAPRDSMFYKEHYDQSYPGYRWGW